MYNFDFEENEKWKRALDLTNAVWKVVDISVNSNSLKNKIKDLSQDLLILYTSYISDTSKNNEEILLNNIDSIIALLSLAQKTSALKEINFLILKNEYKKIRFDIYSKLEHRKLLDSDNLKGIDNKIEKTDTPIIKDIKRFKEEKAPIESETEILIKHNKERELKYHGNNNNNSGLNERQEKLMRLFKENQNGNIKLRDLKKFFPSITDRTLRTDLKGLCDKGFILRSEGRGQGSFYNLVRK